MPSNSSAVNILTFYAPPNSYPSNQHPPFVRISVDNPANNLLARSLSSYLTYTVNSFSQGDPNYTTINSNTTAKLGGFPAYSLEFSDINTDDNSTYRGLELGTIISGKVLYVNYLADTPTFSTLLPTALKMISSLRINAPAVTKLTPSSLPSLPTTNSPATTTPTYTKTHHSETISSGSFSLPPGGMFKDFTINVPANAVNARLTGSYSVTGGILSLIDVYLVDPSGSYIVNELHPSGDIVKLLSPNSSYTLEFKNNAFFAGETKNVEADFNLDYDLLTPSR